MCGRYSLISPKALLLEGFPAEGLPADYRPRYNIAATQEVLILRLEDGEPRFDHVRWGLIPFWAKDKSIGNRLINARSETVAEKPAFRDALKTRRCLVIADGFYEWKKTEDGKVPWRIRLKSDRPFGFAGLWERWAPEGGEEIRSCTILTMAASPFLQEIHHRMPVSLPPDRREAWIGRDEVSADSLDELLVPVPDGELEAYEVSRIVNSPTNDLPACIEPMAKPHRSEGMGSEEET